MEFSGYPYFDRNRICAFFGITLNKKAFKLQFTGNNMGKTGWLKTKKVTSSFAIVALIAGFLFLDRGTTGNVILNNNYPFDFVSLIGLLLIFCSAVLAVYTIRR